MLIHILTLIVALIISAVAGFFSVYGIGIIFSGSFISAIIMGSVLELGKVVAVSWLYRNFKTATFLLKSYLIGAIVVLSLITSLGIFGYLSRAHLEQTILINTGAASQISLIQTKIDQQKEAVSDYDKRIDLINKAQDNLVKTNRSNTALRNEQRQRENRNQLYDERNKIQNTINDLEQQKVKLENENKKVQLDVGPIRYVSDAIFGNTDQNTVDKTVRFLIIIIMFVFDPLAIALIVAANHGLVLMKKEKDLTPSDDPDILRIRKNSLKEFE